MIDCGADFFFFPVINITLIDSHTGRRSRLLLSVLLLASVVPPGESKVKHCNRSYLFAVVCFLIYFSRMGNNSYADRCFLFVRCLL